MLPEAKWLREHGKELADALESHGQDSTIVDNTIVWRVLSDGDLVSFSPAPVWQLWHKHKVKLGRMTSVLRTLPDKPEKAILGEANANYANIPRLFPKGPIADKEVHDFVVGVNESQGTEKSQATIARGITGESLKDYPKAKRLMARARKLRGQGSVVF